MGRKKIQPHVAMGMYEEEMAPIRRAQRIAAEEDACYVQRATEEAKRIAEETKLSYLERNETLRQQAEEEAALLQQPFDMDVVEREEEPFVGEFIPKATTGRNHAYRRKQERRSKRKLRKNATTAIKNYGKRSVQDMNFTRLSGGEVLQNPKSLTLKSDKLWVKATKKKLVKDYPT